MQPRFGRTEARWIAIVVLCAMEGVARAEPGTFDLAWSAPPNCPDARAVRSEIERILHGEIRIAGDAQLVVRADVKTPRAGVWHVEVETDNGHRVARRSLDAPSCEELANATALVVAILIDPRAASGGESEAPGPVPLEAPTPEREIVEPARSEPAPAWWIGASAGATSGYLPRWAPGLGVHAGFEWRALWLEGGGLAWLPVRATVDTAGAQGANFRLFTAYARACAAMTLHAWSTGPCAGIDIANIVATGFGSRVAAASSSATFAAATTGVRVRWSPTPRFSVPLDLEASFPLGSRRFVFTGTDPATIHEPSVGARLAIGAEFRL